MEMRLIVTGASGFVAPYFIKALKRAAPDSEIFECVRGGCEAPNAGKFAYSLDITDADSVDALIADVKPTHVMHLAAVSTLLEAGANPKTTWAVNVFGTTNIARAILRHAPDCVLLFAGTGEVYGASSNRNALLTEETVLRPTNEYAVTKAAAELAIGSLAGSGLRSIRFRPFNHIGPGQTENYALSSFAAQIARIEAGLQPAVIQVGNLTAERDFLDVRDVTDAYVKATLRSDIISNGTILNIASGKPRRLDTLLNRLISMTDIDVHVEEDSSRFRPVDLPKICGDASLARQMLGWAPRRDLDQTLREILVNWRAKIAQAI
jgi:GDP-4-dehydro-6-deoxy-D-mannose reductase